MRKTSILLLIAGGVTLGVAGPVNADYPPEPVPPPQVAPVPPGPIGIVAHPEVAVEPAARAPLPAAGVSGMETILVLGGGLMAGGAALGLVGRHRRRNAGI